jgi:hypothetical protein
VFQVQHFQIQTAFVLEIHLLPLTGRMARARVYDLFSAAGNNALWLTGAV